MIIIRFYVKCLLTNENSLEQREVAQPLNGVTGWGCQRTDSFEIHSISLKQKSKQFTKVNDF
jgi:hypothetical protein